MPRLTSQHLLTALCEAVTAPETGLLSVMALVCRLDRGNEAGPVFLLPGTSWTAPSFPSTLFGAEATPTPTPPGQGQPCGFFSVPPRTFCQPSDDLVSAQLLTVMFGLFKWLEVFCFLQQNHA